MRLLVAMTRITDSLPRPQPKLPKGFNDIRLPGRVKKLVYYVPTYLAAFVGAATVSNHDARNNNTDRQLEQDRAAIVQMSQVANDHQAINEDVANRVAELKESIINSFEENGEQVPEELLALIDIGLVDKHNEEALTVLEHAAENLEASKAGFASLSVLFFLNAFLCIIGSGFFLNGLADLPDRAEGGLQNGLEKRQKQLIEALKNINTDDEVHELKDLLTPYLKSIERLSHYPPKVTQAIVKAFQRIFSDSLKSENQDAKLMLEILGKDNMAKLGIDDSFVEELIKDNQGYEAKLQALGLVEAQDKPVDS